MESATNEDSLTANELALLTELAKTSHSFWNKDEPAVRGPSFNRHQIKLLARYYSSLQNTSPGPSQGQKASYRQSVKLAKNALRRHFTTRESQKIPKAPKGHRLLILPSARGKETDLTWTLGLLNSLFRIALKQNFSVEPSRTLTRGEINMDEDICFRFNREERKNIARLFIKDVLNLAVADTTGGEMREEYRLRREQIQRRLQLPLPKPSNFAEMWREVSSEVRKATREKNPS